jgi:hypothetical protein
MEIFIIHQMVLVLAVRVPASAVILPASCWEGGRGCAGELVLFPELVLVKLSN